MLEAFPDNRFHGQSFTEATEKNLTELGLVLPKGGRCLVDILLVNAGDGRHFVGDRNGADNTWIGALARACPDIFLEFRIRNATNACQTGDMTRQFQSTLRFDFIDRNHPHVPNFLDDIGGFVVDDFVGGERPMAVCSLKMRSANIFPGPRKTDQSYREAMLWVVQKLMPEYAKLIAACSE